MSNLGSDWSCIYDLSPSGHVVSQSTLLAEACVRRITTPRGRLLDDPDYGIDVREWLNDGATLTELSQRRAIVASELAKDDRVVTATATITFIQGLLTLYISLDTVEGAVDLVVAISDVSVDLLRVS